jgi:hypothetical protein
MIYPLNFFAFNKDLSKAIGVTIHNTESRISDTFNSFNNRIPYKYWDPILSSIVFSIIISSLIIIIVSPNISIIFALFYCITYSYVYRIITIILNFFGSAYNKYISDKVNNLVTNLLNFKPLRPIYHIIYYYISFIFILRNYFQKDRVWIMYTIGVLFFINFFLCKYDYYYHFTQQEIIIGLLLTGVNLLSWDNLGDVFSSIMLRTPASEFTVGLKSFLLVNSQHRFVIIRKISRLASLGSLILGKTTLTSTARATIAIGLTSTAALAGNAYLDRKHDAVQQESNRKHDGEQQEANRKVEHRKLDVQERTLDVQERTLKFEQKKYEDQQAAKKWW